MVLKNPFDSVTFGNSLLLRVDGAIGAISLSPSGRDAVLAGRRGLFIIDLDEPFTTPRWLHHITSWEVADVQWSPHHFAKPSWCISTLNQKALLWDLARPSDTAIVNVLHEHTRAITDINFHPSDPEILATCSIDTFVLSWDMRTPRKAVQQWAEWRAGATQVKWNHKNPYEIASSHDHSFYLWDTRKGSLPVLKIEDAHSGKINGINFTDGIKNIITCSNDRKIKFWDLTTPHAKQVKQNFNIFDENRTWEKILPSIVVEADFPVARARTLPFGSDKSCGVMPLRGGNDAIHIIDVDEPLRQYNSTKETQHLLLDPVYSFKGHGGPMKDFLWRTRHEFYDGFDTKRSWKDYQLVTWSSLDFDLKLWPCDDNLYKLVNYNPHFQKMFDSLPAAESPAAESPSAESPAVESPVKQSPEVESRSNSSVAVNGMGEGYKYDSYCIEPPITLNNILYKNRGDILSSTTMFQIARKHKNLPTLPSQLNHLAWISGVRIGRTNDLEQLNNETSTPMNLGEEVTFVAHTFPKVRFEKISVSTGELILSLRGPKPSEPEEERDESKANETTVTDESESPVAANNTNNDTIISEKEPETKPEDENEQKLVFIRLEINFPRNYPYLENVPSAGTSKKFQYSNYVRFDIEESYELTKEIKEEMLKNLEEIAFFFSNKHHRFCLEPLLRYLMGDKIDLNDSLIQESHVNETTDVVQEIGNEGWADDLINQQPSSIDTDDDEVFEEDLSDFMPALNDDEMVNSVGSLGKDDPAMALRSDIIKGEDTTTNNKYYDSTPIPKGCGAMWSRTGQLVCFFIPKESEEDSKALQKFSIFKFTDAGFSVDSNDGGSQEDEDSENESGEGNESDTSSTSTDSFVDEWDDIEQVDLTSRFRVPGLFKTSVGLGNRYISGAGNSSSFNRNTSHGGTGSNYKSSVPGADLDFQFKKRKSKSSKKNKNIVGIFDFSHLLPDKQELAREYRVLGDTPENLAKYNSQVAFKYGLNEIGDAWKLLEMVLIKDIEINSINPVYYSAGVSKNDNSIVAKNMEAMNHLIKVNEMTKKLFENKTYRFYWGSHPFGYSWLIKEMMNYFEKKGNLQMVVMISCILYENTKNVSSNLDDMFNIPIHTPYEIKPQPPSISQIRRMNDSMRDTYISSRDSFTTDLSDSKNELYENKNRNSSLLVFRRESLNKYARSVTSDDDTLEQLVGLSYGSNLTPSQSLLRRNFSMSPSLETDVKHKRSSDYRKPKGIASARKVPKKGTVRPPPSVQITFENLETLDLFDDVYTKPLLSLEDENKLKLFREQYAEMLYSWGLSANRIKILKFNYPNGEHKSKERRFQEHECSFGFRKQGKLTGDVPYVYEDSTIDSAQNNPWIVNAANDSKYCVLCNLLVKKRLVVCTNCEHVLHSDCALDWWDDNQEEECPSGCGCKCLNYHL